jgi:ligand-binding sensor domain-containing protein/signal transduction histidine kinase
MLLVTATALGHPLGVVRTDCDLDWGRLAVGVTALAACVASGQWTNAPSQGFQKSPFVCRVWRAEDGLPQDSVGAIVQTGDGYLWLGTGGGLARFDGVRFKVFGLADGLPSLNVKALLEDRQGGLWIGTANGLCRYWGGRFTSWMTGSGLAGNNISGLAEGRDGAIWIGTTTGLNCCRDGTFETIGAKVGLVQEAVRTLVADQSGAIWVSIGSLGLMRWENGAFVPATNARESQLLRPYSLLKDHTGRIWGCMVGRVFCVEGSSVKTYGGGEGLPNVMLLSLGESADGTIWVGSLDQGLYYLREGRFHPVHRADGLSEEGVRVVVEDREQNLWVGTQDSGLNRLRPRKLATRRIWEGETEVRPVSLAEGAGGALWVGTMGHGLYRLEGEKQEPVLTNRLWAYNRQVSALLVAREGSLWFGAWSTVFQWDGDQLHSTLLGDAVVTSICEDYQEGLWVGSQNGILRLFRKGEVVAFTNGLPRAAIAALVQEGDGTLWIGSYGGGLAQFKEGHCRVFDRRHGLGSNVIRALCIDSGGTLWIGTEGGGLSCFQAGTIRSFGRQNGLVDDTILQILVDGLGNLWLGTYHGIWRVSRHDVNGLVAGTTLYAHPRVFGRSDGLESEQCAGGFGTCLKTRAGLFYFSTARGIVMIDPQPQSDTSTPPVVWLEEMLVDGQTQERGRPAGNSGGSGEAVGAVRVPPGRHQLEFHYTGLNFSAPENVVFRYRLEGLDTDWIEAGPRRIAYYSHVPPGRYRFEVVAHGGEGEWSQSGAGVALAILPHFWQTWWFYSFGGLVCLGLVGGVVRYATKRKMQRKIQRLAQMHAVEKERARIARDIHDDIGAAVSQLIMLGELAGRASATPEEARRHVGRMAEKTRDLAQAMDETIWAVNPLNDSLASFVSYLQRFAGEFFEASPIRCRLDAPLGAPDLALEVRVRHNLFLAAKEALNNVVKHSGAREVWLRVRWDGALLAVSIEDDGKGFVPGPAGAGQDGLSNMRARLDEVGGACVMESRPGAGCCVRFTLPLPGEEGTRQKPDSPVSGMVKEPARRQGIRNI